MSNITRKKLKTLSVDGDAADAAIVKGLSHRDRLFVDLYLGECRLNAIEAARRAGYPAGLVASARTSILAKPDVRKAVEALLAKHSLTREAVLHEISRVLFGPTIEQMEPFLNGRTTLKALAQSGVDLACITEVKVSPGRYGTVRSVKMADKIQAARAVLSAIEAVEKGSEGGDDDGKAAPVTNIFVERLQMAMVQSAERPFNPRLPSLRELIPRLAERARGGKGDNGEEGEEAGGADRG